MARNNVPDNWREKSAHYQLAGVSEQKVTLPSPGTLLGFTEIKDAPTDFVGEVPYIMGLVELPAGEHLTTQIVDSPLAELKIGMKVESVLRKVHTQGPTGLIEYGTKFRLVF